MTAFNSDVAFVHIPKCAGHSCREYMAEHLEGVQDLADMMPAAPHIALRDFEPWIGRKPESFHRIFAVVRNPYEHQLSQWVYWKDMYAKGFRGEQFDFAAMYPDLTHWLLDPNSDWHVYDARHRNGMSRTIAPVGEGFNAFGGYYPYWLAVDGKVPDNVRLVRFERLETDFPKALGTVGEMPRSNAGPGFKLDVPPYYSDLAREIVERKFEWAFQYLYEKWT